MSPAARRLTTVLLWAALGAAVLLTGLLRRHTAPPPVAAPVPPEQSAFAERFQWRRYDAAGRPRWVLDGAALERRAADGRLDIEWPRLLERDAGLERAWRIQAERAWSPNDTARELTFQGGVRVQATRRERTEWRLAADTLMLHEAEGLRRLSAPGAVRLEGPDWWTHGRDLDAWPDAGRLTLSAVWGRHAAR
ncbi:MAG: hypothetical protein KatS3mg121_0560 [Gammaproteobacteria bacterium]|nr:MAG: hypothetical protein KatS3mg121_0560 [Gammaproteobacteria bacterium]